MFKDYSKRSKESSSGGIIKVSMRPFTTLRKNCLNSKISFLSFTETPAVGETGQSTLKKSTNRPSGLLMPLGASALAENAWKEADYIVVMSFRGALAIQSLSFHIQYLLWF